MSGKLWRWLGVVLLMSVAAVGASAQTPGSGQSQPGIPPQGPRVFRRQAGPGPMAGVFSFVEPLGENSAVVQGAPFSAQVVRETVQQLADGNVIDRKSAGLIARDGEGRTRREMTLENIGPLAAQGTVPHLVFISDPVAGTAYTLNENDKTALEMRPRHSRAAAGTWRPRKDSPEFRSETTTESLGQKTLDGVLVEGTRTTRTIPAGQIGNARPIAIVTDRWYSQDLQVVVRLQRTDPRFGTTSYELTKISLSAPSPTLFMVPTDYTITKGRFFRSDGPGGGEDNLRPPLH